MTVWYTLGTHIERALASLALGAAHRTGHQADAQARLHGAGAWSSRDRALRATFGAGNDGGKKRKKDLTRELGSEVNLRVQRPRPAKFELRQW